MRQQHGWAAGLCLLGALIGVAPAGHAQSTTDPPPAQAAVPEESPATAQAAALEAEQAAQEGFEPSLHIKIFSDINFDVRTGENAAFRLGGVDFFLTGELSEQFSALSESVLEFLDGGTAFDLERIYLEWHPRSWLQLRFGRDHLMMGRYMQTYHHALLFQLATERPLLFAFEDEGGLLPAHQIGIEAKGDVTLPGLVLHYALGLGNGRGQFGDDVLNTFDRDGFKSRLAQLSVLPDFAPGLELGVSGYWDQIAPGYSDPSGTALIVHPVHEYIAAAHAAYVAYPIDAQAEGYWLLHHEQATEQTTHMLGGFLQLGIDFAAWGPYARFEAIQRDSEDAFFNVSAAPLRFTELRGGLRYSLADQAVLKLECAHEFEASTNSLVLQAAFGVP
ncbi:MAG: hypothetical protein ABI895_13220 [Deltaproteobacteria bacterium]